MDVVFIKLNFWVKTQPHCVTFYITLVLPAVKEAIRRLAASSKEKYQNAKRRRPMSQTCFQKQGYVQEL